MKKLLALLLVGGMLAAVNLGCGGGTTKTTAGGTGPGKMETTTKK